MVLYQCETCLKIFKLKGDFLRHINRKYKCTPVLQTQSEINSTEKKKVNPVRTKKAPLSSSQNSSFLLSNSQETENNNFRTSSKDSCL